MQFGIFSVSDITRDPVSGETPSEAERIDAVVRIAQKAEEVGLDVFATEARRYPQTPQAPTHASLVRAKYGDQAPRQPRANANRGDNVTGTAPYQDTDAELQAVYPAP